MTENGERTNPEMVVDLMASCSRVIDRQPEFARLVHDLVLEQLKNGPKITEGDPWEHVAQHLKDILPGVTRDPRVVAMAPAVLQEYARMPSTPDTRLREHPGDNSIGAFAAFGGALVGGLALVGIALYCTAGVEADPGTSAEVHHVPGFC